MSLLKLDRIGPILSDRIILGKESDGVKGLHADHSLFGWLLRIISWISSPSCYSSENRRTIACVKEYLTDQIGMQRLQRTCRRYGLNLDEMAEEGRPLLSRHIAQIMTGIKDVKTEDIDELIKLSSAVPENWPAYIDRVDPTLRDCLSGALNSESLTSEIFARSYQVLRSIARTEDVDELIEVSKLWPEHISAELLSILREADHVEDLKPATLADVKTVLRPNETAHQLMNLVKRWPADVEPKWRPILKDVSNCCELKKDVLARLFQERRLAQPFAIVPPVAKEISGAEPTELLAQSFFDSLLADRERLVLSKENPSDPFETFVHNFVVRIIGREMEVGMLIPAPNRIRPHLPPEPQFYRVSAKIISGEGQVSYVLMPATLNTDLKPIRFFRGTSTRASAIDSSSTMITDMEKELGRSSYESGKMYEPHLKSIFNQQKIALAAGHSLGSTTLQYLVVDDVDGEIEKAYFFNGPGLPPGEVERFNARMQQRNLPEKLKLVIRDSNTDIFSTVGTKHLGYGAPLEKVDIDYLKYFPRNKTSTGYAHVQVPDRENPYVGALGGLSPAQIDQELHRLAHPDRLILCLPNETLRQLIGPSIAVIIRLVRDIFRLLFGSRTMEQLGLQYGKYEADGKWAAYHGKFEENGKWHARPLGSLDNEPLSDPLNPQEIYFPAELKI